MAQTESLIIGNHAYFVLDGTAFTVPSSGTAGRASKPGAADTSWRYLGILQDLSIQHNRESRDVFAPTPGSLRLYNRLETKRMLAVKFTALEISTTAWEHIFGSLQLAASGSSLQYNPLEGATKRGWLKVQQYSGTDALVNTVDLYVHLAVTGEIQFNDQVVTVPFEATVLHSTLNTGTLA
jgi:hypothetical protein